jgi:hypothetical protein
MDPAVLNPLIHGFRQAAVAVGHNPMSLSWIKQLRMVT